MTASIHPVSHPMSHPSHPVSSPIKSHIRFITHPNNPPPSWLTPNAQTSSIGFSSPIPTASFGNFPLRHVSYLERVPMMLCTTCELSYAYYC
ncbi:hypothetical protein CEXT_617601 [Caerostris extrusa]|uniref:Uncharacterized protein n=1 Tax=Caerostris extrusa TaxID=172846 RepID=A0AAV4PUU8_CAEEX|nr:hypothetical protein CEXT_617601 [Caerostris extrusa]